MCSAGCQGAADELLDLSAELIGLPAYEQGIRFPNPDFAAFAEACGGRGFTVAEPGKLRSTIAEALACDGPAIIDAIVAGDELPDVPHLDLAQIGQFAKAKIKEAVLSVTGG